MANDYAYTVKWRAELKPEIQIRAIELGMDIGEYLSKCVENDLKNLVLEANDDT